MLSNKRLRATHIVETAKHAIERRVDRRSTMAEIQRAAVIAALHRHNFLAAGKTSRRRQRHHIGFSARVGEAHQVEVKALGHRLGKQHLVPMMCSEVEPGLEGFRHRRLDARVRVAIDAGRIFAD